MSNKYLYLNGVMRGPVVDDDFMFQPEIVNDLPSIPIIGNHSFKENQIYEVGKDFDIKYSNGFDIKDHVDHFDESHFGYDTSIHQVSIPVDQSHKGKPEKFLPPDNGDICWQIGSETFTRKEVYYLLWTQRSMISNDLKVLCGDELTKNAYHVLDNPRIPEY